MIKTLSHLGDIFAENTLYTKYKYPTPHYFKTFWLRKNVCICNEEKRKPHKREIMFQKKGLKITQIKVQKSAQEKNKNKNKKQQQQKKTKQIYRRIVKWK